MCTAVTWEGRRFCAGRTLDHTMSYGEEVTIMPRRYPLRFRGIGTLEDHFAMIGMAWVQEDYPLYYDGINEKGLYMAGLNFVGNARYAEADPKKNNVAQFELLPWILAQCGSVKAAKALLENTCVTGDGFRPELPPAQLHWLMADKTEAAVLEIMADGMRILDNPVGVLTNNPPFPLQMFRLNDFMGLSPEMGVNRLSDRLAPVVYSRGLGALGLPGDLSSQSRFVRAAFGKLCGLGGDTEVGQLFHVLGTVEMCRGCCRTETGEWEYTVYTGCCDGERGIYYYTTCGNRQITAVDMHRENLEKRELVRYPLRMEEQIRWENG